MMKMFQLVDALAKESGGSPLITVTGTLYIDRVIHIKYRLAQLEEERAWNFKARRNQRRESIDG